MKKPREFYVAIHPDWSGIPFLVAKHHHSLITGLGEYDLGNIDFEIIKVQEITNEPRTIQSQASRAKSKTSRPERISKAGKARHKPRAKAAAGKGKAAHKESGKGKGAR